MKKLVTLFMALAVVITACSKNSEQDTSNEGKAVLRLTGDTVLPEEYRIGRVPMAQAKALTSMDTANPESVKKSVAKALSTLHLSEEERDEKQTQIRVAFVELKARYPDLYQSVVGMSCELEPGKRKAHVRIAVKSALLRGQVDTSVYRPNVYIYDDEMVKTPAGWKSLGNPTSVGIFFLHEHDRKEIISGLIDMGLTQIDLKSI